MNRRLIISLLMLVSAVSSLVAAPYFEGSMRITFRDSVRGRDIPVTIIYPADGASGVSKPLVGTSTNTIPTFKVVVMGHGHQMPVTAYRSFATNICSNFQNTIVILPESGAELFPNHGDFAADMVSCVRYLQRENLRVGSIWYGHVSPTTIVAGHSMGGGAAFLAARTIEQDADLVLASVIALAPAETNPSSKQAARSVTAPTLVLAGGRDCVTPLAGTVQPIYDSVSSTCKDLALIPGGSHCQFADDNAACSLGEFTCRATIARPTQFERTFAYVNMMLRGSDSVSLPIMDTQIQTSLTALTERDIQVTAREGCIGDTIVFTTTTTNPYLQWQPGNKDGAQYTLIIRDTITRVSLVNTQCFGQTIANITIRGWLKPTIDIVGPLEICPDGSVVAQARATNATRIVWSTGEEADSIRIRSAGSYTATAIGRGGCQQSASITVTQLVVPPIPVDMQGDTVFCNGLGSVQLLIRPDAQRYERVEWSTGTIGPTLRITEPGEYTLFARVIPRDPNDCLAFSDTVHLTIRSIDAPVPKLTFQRDTLWSTPGESYLWSVDGIEIQGWRERYLVPTTTGMYRVRVGYDTRGACTNQSESFDVRLTSVRERRRSDVYRVEVVVGAVRVTGLAPLEGVRLVSLLGTPVASGFADQNGQLDLPVNVPTGIYVVAPDSRLAKLVLLQR